MKFLVEEYVNQGIKLYYMEIAELFAMIDKEADKPEKERKKFCVYGAPKCPLLDWS